MNSFNQKRPTSLNIVCNSSPTVRSLETSSSIASQTCTTPEIRDLLATNLVPIVNLIFYHENLIKNGQNGIVKRVTLFAQGKTRELIEKKGGFSVERENMMATAIKNTDKNFPQHLFALPIHQVPNQISNTLYTCYRKLGDLQTNAPYIQQKIQIEDSSVFSYIFHIIYQLTLALDALHNSKFTVEKDEFHQGIVHNDIKPDNIFLKENGDIELADLGCAYFKDDKAPQFSTYLFSAPELWTNENFCKKFIPNIDKADIWSLGATLMYLLTKKFIAPSFPSKKSTDFDKAFIYKTWAESYSQIWKSFTVKILNLTENFTESDIIISLKKKLNHSYSINNNKLVLQNLALLMQAPIEFRPNARELKNILDKLDFIITAEPQVFASQLIDRLNNNVKSASQPTNGYVCVSDLNMKMTR